MRILPLALILVTLGWMEPARAVEWSDLSDSVDLDRDVVAGDWSVGPGGITTGSIAGARLAIPITPPREYDFRVRFTRRSGRHSIALIFVAGNGQGTFEVDAWGRHLAGIQRIDGQTMRENSTRSENVRLENGRQYTAEVQVRRAEVRVLLDGRQIAFYRGDGSNLTLDPIWRMPQGNRLGVGAYEAETTFHAIELRNLSGQPLAMSRRRSDPSTSSRAAANKSASAATTTTRPARPTVPPPRPAAGAATRRVLLVIANQHFFYREYADPLRELERAGLIVDVAAGRKADCYPHPGSGHGSDGGRVTPDLALSDVDPSRYDAIVFSGGWGSSMYQYAFNGRYDNAVYNGDSQTKATVNRLLTAFAAGDKYICGICNGVSVLAWSRVNGQSLLAGKTCTAPSRSAPSGIYDGRRGTPSIRWHVEKNGGRLLPAGSIGNPRSRADDVAVDGKIITAEDDQSAREAGRQLAMLLTR